MNRQKLILEEFRKARGAPFRWDGQHDCLGWAGDVAARILGHDVIGDLRGRYTSEKGARRVMVAEGWESLADVASSFFSREIPVAHAQTGDWGIVVNETGTETIGVFVGAMIAAKTPTGIGQ